jgi:predicted transposase YdaD
MEHPFDPTVKTLTELAPADWLPLAKRRRRRVTVEDSDIGTIVSGATDKLMRVYDKPEYLLHLDFEAGHFRSELPLRLRLYNYSDQVANALFEEVLGMEQSATYQAIVRRGRDEGRTEGRAEGERRLLLLQGEKKFGPPKAAVRAAIEGIDDLARLEELGLRLISASSWQELVLTKAQRRPNGKRKSRD